MSVLSRVAGMRVTTERYSPGNAPFGNGTDAVRHMWSDVSPKYGEMRAVDRRAGGARPKALAEAPWDTRMDDRRDKLD